MTNLSTLYSTSVPDPVSIDTVRVNYTTTPNTLTADDCTGFKVFTNTGASTSITVNLPAGADGLKLSAMVTAAYDFIFVTNGTETIRYKNTTSKAGGSIKSANIGDILTLSWSGTQWLASGFSKLELSSGYVFLNDGFEFSLLMGG